MAIVGAVYLGYFATRKRSFDWHLLFSTLASLDWKWLLLAAVFGMATYYGRALRWAVLLKPLRPKPRMWNLFSATVIGFTAITLLGRPGEFVRPYLISVKEKVPFSSQIAAWLLERIYDLLIALVVFGYGLSRVAHSGAQVGPTLTWMLAFGGRFVGITCALCLGILLLIGHFSEAMRLRLLDALRFLPERRFKKTELLVNAFVQGVESTRTASAVFLLTAYTVLEWLLIGSCYLCVTKAFGSVLQFTWVDILIFMGFVSFGSIVQIPAVGGGVQVISVLVLTELFGLRLEVATSIAVLVWVVTFVAVVPFGLFLALREGLNWASLRAVGREASQ